MPECVKCSSPVARHGSICNPCSLEGEFGTVDDERVEELRREADDDR